MRSVILKFSTRRVPGRLVCVLYSTHGILSCILLLCGWKLLANSLIKHLLFLGYIYLLPYVLKCEDLFQTA